MSKFNDRRRSVGTNGPKNHQGVTYGEAARADGYGITDDDIIEAAAIAVADSRRDGDDDMWSGTDKVDIHVDYEEADDGTVAFIWEAYPVVPRNDGNGVTTDGSTLLAIGWTNHFP